jgi:hypothetical protein
MEVPRIVIECDTDNDMGIVRRVIERDISAREQRVGTYDWMADDEHELRVLRGVKTQIVDAELDCRFGPGYRPLRQHSL